MADTVASSLSPVGLAASKDLAIAAPNDWGKAPPKGADSQAKRSSTDGVDLGPDLLVDILNEEARRISKEARSSGSELDNGYVTREIAATSAEHDFLSGMIELAFQTSGMGNPDTQLAQVFARHDRFSRAMVPSNAVFSGYTFFTRPRLNLADWNLIGDRKFSTLKTNDTTSVPFAIRCMLDTKYCGVGLGVGEDSRVSGDLASKCPLIDINNPFFVILSNALKSVSGFLDPNLVTETSDGGFFSEDQTVVIGGDRLSRTYDINCSFRDYPGSPVAAIFDYWCQYMANIQDGSMQQYSEAIDANRIDYTVSIYRFLMDRTNRHIARWAKCTGCYPIAPPTGVPFNMNEGEFMVNAATTFSVPFKVNRIEYDDPVILKEFNMLVRRYSGFGTDKWEKGPINAFSAKPQNNFAGVPYIRPSIHGYELVWLQRPDISGEAVLESGKGMIDLSGSNSI